MVRRFNIKLLAFLALWPLLTAGGGGGDGDSGDGGAGCIIALCAVVLVLGGIAVIGAIGNARAERFMKGVEDDIKAGRQPDPGDYEKYCAYKRSYNASALPYPLPPAHPA